MTVTWIDVPNTPISRRETLDFTTTSDPIAISIKFPTSRPEELVYRDGVFQFPYLGSTKVGNTFHLNRITGWPENVRVYVMEAPGGTTGPVPSVWQLLYSVDFTTETPYNDPSSGVIHPVTLQDGSTWYFMGSRTGADFAGAIDSNGIGWDQNIATGASPGFIPLGPITTPFLWFPFSQLPGYDPEITTCVRILPPSNIGAAVGFASMSEDVPSGVFGSTHLAANRIYDAFVTKYDSTANGGQVSGLFGFEGITNQPVSNNGQNGMALIQFPGASNAHMVAATDSSVGTGFTPDVADMSMISSSTGFSRGKVTLPRPHPGIMLMVLGGGNPGASYRIPTVEVWQYYPEP